MSGIHFKSAEEQAAEGFEPLPNSGSTTGQPSLMQKGFNPSSASDSQFSQGGFGSAVDSGNGVSQQGFQDSSTGNKEFSQTGFQQTGYQDPSSSTNDSTFSQSGFQDSSTGSSSDFNTSGGRTSETGPSAARGENFGGGVSGKTAEDTSGSQFNQGSSNQDTSGSGFSQGGFQDTSPNAGFSQGGFQDTSDLTSRPDSDTLTAGKADQTFSESGTRRSENDASSGVLGTTSGSTGRAAVGDYTQGGYNNDDSGVGKQGNFGHFEEGGR
ncbi:hypothetical protein MMC34_002693 [Xylographa carneopallida]|nr:hypothetical protein [Xylographa carneopallida]